MAHYVDLASCDYFPDIRGVDIRAVGWLEAGHQFVTGPVEPQFKLRLRELAAEAWQPVVFLGGQECHLCTSDPFYGSRTLIVPASDIIYASPEAIVHYVDAHSYQPPDVFRAAVVDCPVMKSQEYFNALKAAGWKDAAPSHADPDPLPEAVMRHLKMIRARGQAIVDLLHAYEAEVGAYPASLDVLGSTLPVAGSLRYEARSNGFQLELDCRDTLGAVLMFDTQRPTWNVLRVRS